MGDKLGDDILLYGDPVLRRVAAQVSGFDGSLRLLAERLLRIQTRERAIGVAANQIGAEWSVFSVDEGMIRRGGAAEVLVNPVVAATDGEVITEEGCLCFPGIFIEVARPRWVAIRAFDCDGRPVEREAEGMLARAYLHEIDHLQGRLFIDRVDPPTRRLVLERMRAFTSKSERPGNRR
ncbi:MAG: peptide deformylase [Candidatus Zixiibacteriota bacterium]